MTIPMDQCELGAVYNIVSRNLAVGVYDGKGGFVGIRQKFMDRFLFTEFHRDTGAPHGTVTPLEKIGKIPDGMRVLDIEDVVERECSCGHPSRGHTRQSGEHCWIGCGTCACTAFDGKRYVQSYPPLLKFLEEFPTMGRAVERL